jgi:hypothetical protein
MSRGPGRIEKLIGELFTVAADRALTVADLCDHAFGLSGTRASRSQRIATLRAAHALLRRAAAAEERWRHAYLDANAAAGAALGRQHRRGSDLQFDAAVRADPTLQRARLERDRLAAVERWRTTETDDGRLHFHPFDFPVRVWAVDIAPAGVVWAEAEIVSVTATKVNVRYSGEPAHLDRQQLGHPRSWAVWRGVMFTSARNGYAAMRFEQMWFERHGRSLGAERLRSLMPLEEARKILGVKEDYSREDIIAGFRREAKRAHPDLGGTAAKFRRLVEARDRLLASIGTSAPAPRMPKFWPKGLRGRYVRVRATSRRQLSHIRRIGRR